MNQEKIISPKGDWINPIYELPPENGCYEITNFPGQTDDHLHRPALTLAFYDGFGFQWNGVYVSPKYWRFPPKFDERRYGKQK